MCTAAYKVDAAMRPPQARVSQAKLLCFPDAKENRKRRMPGRVKMLRGGV